MRHVSMLLVCVGLLMAAGLLLPDAALAQDTTSALKDTDCSQYAGVTNRIVTCVRTTLQDVMIGDGSEGSSSFFGDFYALVQKMIAGFLTLAVIIYGILAAYGMMEKPSRDAMMFVVKFAFVTFFILRVDWMYTELTGVMDTMGQAVVGFAPAQEGVEADRQSVCLREMVEATDANEADYTAPWMGMDCLIDSVIGINMVDASKTAIGGDTSKEVGNRLLDGTGLARGLLAFLFSSMGTSILGLIVAVIGFLFVYSMVFLIAKALFTYLMGYLGITVLMIVAPIFIPLVLFRKTKEFFDRWMKLVISFTLQPILVLIFITFSIMAVDYAMFSGKYSVVYRIAGEASKSSGFNLNKYLEEKGIIDKQSRVLAEYRTSRDAVADFTKEVEGMQIGRVTIDCSEAAITNNAQRKFDCQQATPIRKWTDSVNWKKMASARSPAVTLTAEETTACSTDKLDDEACKGRQISREVLAAIIFATLVVFIMNGLVNIVGVIANGLVGEEFQSPNLVSVVSRGGAFSSSYSKMTAGINSLLKGVRR